ncbi:MAG: methionine--tRNA ligase [Bacteroidales bacterium]|nr:methionine--tRNA ligase [Bacteroidales bacterium]
MSTKKPKRYNVTTALPYANGPVHIGHLAGVYVPADIYVRYLRAKQKDVIFIGGSDEHGVPITIKAKNEGKTPQQIVDRYHKMIKKSFEDLGISFDIYSRTSGKIHHETSSSFFKKLYDEGKLTEKSTEQYYDEEAQQFLADRYITGTCPNCGYEKAYGDQCESCGASLSPMELINPVSKLSGAKPVKKQTKHWYLPLDQYEPWLKEWILENHKNDWKSNVYGQCKSWLDNGLNPRAVTRDLNWGVKVPLENAEGKVLYVWFDAPIGYISATRELTGDWEKYWKDEETKLVHFIGKDNIVFHCIIFPSMLKAEGSYILPDNVPANEFMNLEGDKISTSRNWAVWLHEYLEDFKDKQDVLRYVLTANAPETKDNDFTWKDFQARNNNELVAIFGNFVNRALVLTKKYYDRQVPEPGDFTPEDKKILNQVKEYPQSTGEKIERFRIRESLQEMMKLARLGNKYLADNEPWKLIKTNEERVKTIMYVSLQIATQLAYISEPFLPFTSRKMKDMMNLPDKTWDELNSRELIQPGHDINKAKHLFAPVEDKEIQYQYEKLEKSKIENEKAEKQAEPLKDTITYDDFVKLDLRVGTILEAEKMPKTGKLLKLTVDIGIEKRTIVAGIAKHHDPTDIIGKKVAIVANLAPRKLKGIESQGMILMANNTDGDLKFLHPEDDADNGAQIS